MTMSRELMGKIVDEVFDGAIEDASVIEQIYEAIKKHDTPSPSTHKILTGLHEAIEYAKADAKEHATGWEDEFNALSPEEQRKIRHCADVFGVPLIAAYHRAKDLDVIEASPSPQKNLRPLELLDRADDEAIEWVTSNLTAIRRDDGSLHYNLTQIVRAFQAGKERS